MFHCKGLVVILTDENVLASIIINMLDLYHSEGMAVNSAES